MQEGAGESLDHEAMQFLLGNLPVYDAKDFPFVDILTDSHGEWKIMLV